MSIVRVISSSIWVCCGGFFGCASTAPADPSIARTDVAYDLSGEWNDVDADLVARSIIDECLKSRWVETWSEAHSGQRPRLRLYPIRNRTTAFIDHRYFTKQIEAALVGSGKLDVMIPVEEQLTSSSGELGDEGHEMGRDEQSADFVLNGWILSQEDHDGSKEVRAYLTSVEIIETRSQKKAWVGQKRIRKLIERP